MRSNTAAFINSRRLNSVISEKPASEHSAPVPEPKLPGGVVQKVSKTGKLLGSNESTVSLS